MQESVKEMLLKKNQKLIDMVIERAKRDFPEDIVLIGLTGSFSTGDFHKKSDLDLIIVNETERGWGIAAGFILDDVGYDIYCTPWEPRIEAQSKLESPMAGILIDLKVLYCAKPEYLEKLNRYRQKALDLLKKPIGKECMDRARKNINMAKQHYADAMLSDQIGAVRYAAGGVLYETVNALTNLNNTYIKRGIKRYLEEILAYKYLPDNMESMALCIISMLFSVLNTFTPSFSSKGRRMQPKPSRDTATPVLPKGTYCMMRTPFKISCNDVLYLCFRYAISNTDLTVMPSGSPSRIFTRLSPASMSNQLSESFISPSAESMKTLLA